MSVFLTASFTVYTNQERIELIDDQLRETAVALVNSELADLKKINLDKAEELISEELGANRIGKLFYIRNVNDEIIFQSRLATVAKVNFSKKPKQFTTEFQGKYYRVLNLDLPKVPDRTLQIAAVLETEEYRNTRLAKQALPYVIISIIFILPIGYLLSKVLLSPLNKLSSHMQRVSEELKRHGQVQPLPLQLKKYMSDSFFTRDEFSNLLKNTELVLERINFNYKMTKPWSYQMAHEIKTPLSLLKLDHEKLVRKKELDLTVSEDIEKHIAQIDDTVSQFLEWASVDNNAIESNLFAVRLETYLDFIIAKLNEHYSNRLIYQKKESFIIICNPQHLIQLFNNIIENALKYSDKNVVITTHNHAIEIVDQGPGIPKLVMDRLGQPFNRGPQQPSWQKTKSSGLGLAWVKTITQKYNWQLTIKSSEVGTVIRISFPDRLVEDK